MRRRVLLALERRDRRVELVERRLLGGGDAAQIVGARRMRGEVVAERSPRPLEVEQQGRRRSPPPPIAFETAVFVTYSSSSCARNAASLQGTATVVSPPPPPPQPGGEQCERDATAATGSTQARRP